MILSGKVSIDQVNTLQLSGQSVTASASQINLLSDVTANANELNVSVGLQLQQLILSKVMLIMQILNLIQNRAVKRQVYYTDQNQVQQIQLCSNLNSGSITSNWRYRCRY